MRKLKVGDEVEWIDRIHVRRGVVVETDRYWSKLKVSDTGVQELDYVLIPTRRLQKLDSK